VERGESYAQLLDTRGRVLDATAPLLGASVLRPAELRSAQLGPTFAERTSVPGLDEPSRILAVPMARAGRRVVLVVGATRQNRAETLATFRNELLIAGPIALLLASFVGYLLAGVSLRQVERMRRRAASISAETPGDRLPVPGTGDELERLGATLNAMLDRLHDALRREREFVADAGHELRTPLALLRTELELALRHGKSDVELRDALQASSREVDRLAQLADALLLIAHSDRGKLPLKIETIESARLLETVATRFRWRAEQASRSVKAAAPHGVRIRGDGLRLEQALSNLVDNALRYGEGPVGLYAEQVDGHVTLRVRDDGPGFPPDFLDVAFERFTRPKRAAGRAGAGLGLSIVRAIAQAHGGKAEARNRPEGGAEVSLVLPDQVSNSRP
jgi:signal transduction histidine kinase